MLNWSEIQLGQIGNVLPHLYIRLRSVSAKPCETGIIGKWLRGFTAALMLPLRDLPSGRPFRALQGQQTECIHNKTLACVPGGNVLVAMGILLSERQRFPGGAESLSKALGTEGQKDEVSIRSPETGSGQVSWKASPPQVFSVHPPSSFSGKSLPYALTII